MSSGPTLTGVVQRLRSQGDAADGELLTQYATAGDGEAFATVVRRYGGLVLGVARRQLADSHQADDVFQATFLALARAADRLTAQTPLANWLYTVAMRQARKARGRDFRRETVERAAPVCVEASADPLDEISGRELLRVIDEELARLPERYRLPVLLCCVQGLSREEAAGQLGWTDGMVKGRLECGRRLLATRLAARGLSPSAVVLAPLAAVVVPGELLARTAANAGAPWSKSLPPAVVALARTSSPRQFLHVAAVAGSLLVVGLTGWAIASGGKNSVNPASPTPIQTPPAVAAVNADPDEPLPTGSTLRFGSSRFRHGTTIEFMTVSSDGKVALAASGGRVNRSIRAYNLETGRVLYELTGEFPHIEAATFSRDGKTLATKWGFAVHLHDAKTGNEDRKIEYPNANPYSATECLVLSPDGKWAAVANAEGKGLHLIDLEKNKVARELPFDHVVYAVAFSPDSKLVVGGGHDGYNSKDGVYFARLWEVATGKELRRFSCGQGSIRALAFSPDGATLAGGGDDARLRLWEVATGKERHVFQPDGYRIRSVAFSPDGKTVAAAGDSIRLYDPTTGQERAKIDRQAIKLHFTPDSTALIGAVSGTIYRWDVATGRTIRPAEGGDSVVEQIEVTADGKRVITRGTDGDAHVWDARTAEHLRRVNVSWQRGLALSPDGRYLVWPVADESVKYKNPAQPNAIYTGNRLRLYDLAENKFIDRFPGFEGDAHNLDFTPDGKTLVTVDLNGGTVRVWDVATGKEQRSFGVSGKVKNRLYYVWRAKLSPDGKTLAVNYQQEGRSIFGTFAVRLWDVATGKQLHEFVMHWRYVETMAFSPDSKFLVTGSEPLSEFAQEQLKLPPDQVYVWNVATGKQVARLPIGASAAAFSPDGKTLATATPDGLIQLWDVATWKPRAEFRGHRDRITSMTFTPDGRLLTGSVDTTVLAWDTKAAKGGGDAPPAKP